MLDKLLGKKSGYYLELPEEEIAAIPEPLAAKAPAAQSVPAAAKPTAPKAEKNKKASQKAAPTTAQQAAPTAPITDTTELIRSAIAAAGNKPKPEPPAPAPVFDYTAPVAKAKRRLPGPSMSPFKTMAKDMKKTKAGF